MTGIAEGAFEEAGFRRGSELAAGMANRRREAALDQLLAESARRQTQARAFAELYEASDALAELMQHLGPIAERLKTSVEDERRLFNRLR